MKHRMFRLLSLLLILCLTLPSALAETAQEGPEITEELPSFVDNLFILNDTLHVQTSDEAFYRQVEGGWQLLGACPDGIDIRDFFAEDGKVWLLVIREGTSTSKACHQIIPANFGADGSFTGLGEPLTIDWELEANEHPSMYGMVIQGDMGYILAEHPDDWSQQRLYRVDMTTGEATKITDGPITELIAYKDGLMLVRRHTWDDRDENDDPLPPQIMTFDPATNELTGIAQMNDWDAAAMAYDPETDAIYFSDSTHVYKAAGNAPEVVGYLLPSNMSRQNASSLVHHGRYHVDDSHEVSSAPVDPALTPKHVLRIEQIYEVDDLVRDYAKLHPDVAIEYSDQYWSDLEDFTRLMQGDNAPVLMRLDMGHDFPILRDKKYLIDLSSSQVLMDTVSRMYPHLTKDLLVDGQLFALPFGLEVSCLGYYPRAMEKAGVPVESLPTTYGELLDFLVTWHDDYFPDNEGMEVVEYAWDLRRSIFSWLYYDQQLVCESKGIPLTYDTPTFRSLLNRLDEIMPIIDVVAPKLDDSANYEYAADNALITENECFPLPRTYLPSPEWNPQPLILSMDHDTAPMIRAYMSVIAINPFSTETETAIDLMEYIAQNLSQSFRTTMMPDCNDPIEVRGYDADLAYWRDQIAATERRLEEDPDNRGLQDDLARYQKVLADREETGRWAMTEEDILWYRENIAPYLTLYTSIYASESASQQMSSILRRYIDGQLTADGFIQEIDRIVWMVQMEQ